MGGIFQGKPPWVDSASADCSGFLVRGAVGAPAPNFIQEPQISDCTSIGHSFGKKKKNKNPYNLSKSTAIHLQFVRQYVPHLYRRTFLASKLRRKGNPAIRLPFVLQYASHLYGSTPPFVRQYFWKNTGGWGHRNVSD